MSTNPELVNFFKQCYAPARVCLVGASDIAQIVRHGQSPLNNGQPSKWSHAFIFGDIEGGQIEIYESEFGIGFAPLSLRKGAQKSSLTKWCSNKIEHATVLDFKLSPEKQIQVMSVAERLVKEGLRYPAMGVVGTWIAMHTGTMNKQNPLCLGSSMYCSSFVRFCYQEADVDFLPYNSPHISNTAPEHIAKTGKIIAEWSAMTGTITY